MTTTPSQSRRIDNKVDLSLTEISTRIKSLAFPDVDLIVGIANGGAVPAYLVAFHLVRPLAFIRFNYRDSDNHPIYTSPKLIEPPDLAITGQRILLVDDVSVSGATMVAAAAALDGNDLSTFVLKGRADLVAFPEIDNCVNWPWKAG